MAKISIPDKNETVEGFDNIKAFLGKLGIEFDQWTANAELDLNANQETILKAYEEDLRPFMEKKGFKSCDVISVNHTTPNIEAIREKFLSEHTHTEDEVRFFVEGKGLFWFNLDGSPVFSVLCEKGDFLSVPAKTKHWFDLGSEPYVKAIRIFSNEEGWVANYTQSEIDKNYNPKY